MPACSSANAIYFKGKWAVQFDSKHTPARAILLESGRKLAGADDVAEVSFKTADVGEVGLLELRYGGETTSMIISCPRVTVCPNWKTGLTAKDSADGLPARQAQAAELEVLLPRFRDHQTF